MITEYELYSDERKHRNATGTHLVLGGVVTTDKGRKRLRDALSRLREELTLSREMRWGKVSNSYLDAYKAWMGVFFQDRFTKFTLLSVNLSGVEWSGFRPGSNTVANDDDKLAAFFCAFLEFTFGPPRDTKKWWVYPDAGFFSNDAVLSRAAKLYNGKHWGLNRGRFIRRAESRDSKTEDLIQLSDLLLGAIACDKLGPMPTSPAKQAIVEYWQQLHAETPTTQKGLYRLSYNSWLPSRYTRCHR